MHPKTPIEALRSFCRRGSVLAAILVLIASLGGAHAADDTVGAISDVQGTAEIVSSGASAGAAEGAPVHLNDELKTGADGHLQVTFRDDTVLTLGDDAVVVIDRYVYNPDQGVGDVLLTMTQGAFRFATGKLKNMSDKEITVSTPVAEFLESVGYGPLDADGSDAACRAKGVSGGCQLSYSQGVVSLSCYVAPCRAFPSLKFRVFRPLNGLTQPTLVVSPFHWRASKPFQGTHLPSFESVDRLHPQFASPKVAESLPVCNTSPNMSIRAW